MPTRDSSVGQLEIHVLGGSKGESIVLRLPNGSWGVVDCYAKSVDDRTMNPTLCFLKEHEVSELEFLCLTHPHDDHYRGMSHLLEEYPVKHFWRFQGVSGDQIGRMALYFKVEAERADDTNEKANAHELTKIFQLVKKQRPGRVGNWIQAVAPGQQLYPVPLDSSASFQIWGIAPCGGHVTKYEQEFARCFDADGTLKGKLPHSDHNLVSVGLLVEFGMTRVVLGGDVDCKGWEAAACAVGEERLAAAAVKVSHHGSQTGYSPKLWQHFSAKGKPIAMLTPFLAQRLPRWESLLHIKQYADPVFTTCLPAIWKTVGRAPLSAKADPRSREAVHRDFGAYAAPDDARFGVCTLVFDDSGACVKKELRPPAGQVEM